jgi:CheY-like chemotaxis protein
MMERQLVQMVRLVEDLMDVSRITRGWITLRRERVDLAKVLQQAIETSLPLIEAGGHELSLDLPSEPVFVEADVTRLAQVVSNLLNNAARYTERGGRITVTVSRRSGEAVIAVRDTGIGIAPAMLPRVFEMFSQVDRSLERAQGGLGIGLTLVKRLVEMHGGSVEARSEGPGTGSEFTVRIPALTSSAPGPVRNGDGQAASTPLRILVADDNEDAAQSLAMLLRMLGHEVVTAGDGLEALEVAEGFRPRVILLDIGMPKLNGYDTARRIRELPWTGDVVIVALTGWGQKEDLLRSEQAGFDAHLVKPVDPSSLERLLAQWGQIRTSTPRTEPPVAAPIART